MVTDSLIEHSSKWLSFDIKLLELLLNNSFIGRRYLLYDSYMSLVETGTFI